MRLAAALALVASPAIGQVVWDDGAASLDIVPSDKPGAVADVVYRNAMVSAQDVEVYTLTLDGLSVSVTMQHGRGEKPDTAVVNVPEGYVAYPESITVDEGATGVVVIYSIEGVGM